MHIIEQKIGNDFEKLNGYILSHLASVIMPTYNHAKYVEQAIKSVIKQTYRPIEIILIDDGSTDDTFRIALSILQELELPFLAIHKQNQGSCVSGINNGISLSHGEFLSILASDDIYFPEKLKKSILLLQKSDAMLVIGQDIHIYEDGNLITGSETNLNSIRNWYMKGSLLKELYLGKDRIQFPYLGITYRKEAFDILGYYDPNIFTEDYDMLFRVASSAIRIEFLPMIVGAHRKLPRSKIYNLRVAQSGERVLRKYASSFWIANRAIAYNKIHQARAWWDIDKKNMVVQLLGGIIKYPLVIRYIFSMILSGFLKGKFSKKI